MAFELTPEQIQQIVKPADYSSFGAELKGLMSQFPELPIDQLQQLAKLQGQYNFVNQTGPFGNVNFKQNQDGTYTQQTSLSPEQQKLLSQEQGLQGQQFALAQNLAGQAQKAMGKDFTIQGGPVLPQDFTKERKRIEDALYGRNAGILNDYYKQDMQRFNQEMADRGIGIGTKNYQDQFQNWDRNRNDAYQSARNSAIQMGGQEMSQSYDLAADSRARMIQEQQLKRGQAMGELSGLMSLGSGAGGYQPIVPQATRGDIDIMGMAQGLMNIGSQRQIAGAQGLSQMQQAAIEDARSRGLYALGEANQRDIAGLQADTSIKSAQIGAGATTAAAKIQAELQKYIQSNNQAFTEDQNYINNVINGNLTVDDPSLLGLPSGVNINNSGKSSFSSGGSGKGAGF